MALERAQHVHLWVCIEREGALGEITKERALRVSEVQQLSQDPTSAERICPHGVIKCKHCHIQIPDVSSEAKIDLIRVRELLKPYVPSFRKENPTQPKSS
jgi:hypothetical protein